MASTKRFFKQKISKKADILTIQAGIFDLEACFYTNKKSILFGTNQKLTIQAGWPYIRGPYKRALLYLVSLDPVSPYLKNLQARRGLLPSFLAPFIDMFHEYAALEHVSRCRVGLLFDLTSSRMMMMMTIEPLSRLSQNQSKILIELPRWQRLSGTVRRSCKDHGFVKWRLTLQARWPYKWTLLLIECPFARG